MRLNQHQSLQIQKCTILLHQFTASNRHLSPLALLTPNPPALALPSIDEYVILPFCCQFISQGVSLRNAMEKCFIVLFPFLCIPPAD